jgi:hypothetical protein
MKCRSCGTEIAANALICYKCGTATTEPKIQPPAARRRAGNRWLGVAIGAGLLAAAALAQQAGCLTLLS